jgi:hypothetical protein
MVRPRNRRQGQPPLAESTRQALFILTSAGAAGFSFRAVGPGQLQVTGPAGLPDEACAPVLDAVRQNGSEILRLVKWFNSEAAAGRFWSPRPEPGGRA